MKKSIAFLSKLGLCAIVALGFINFAQAQTANPAGTWVWSTGGRNGGEPRTNTLTLKFDGGKLTGSYAALNAEGKPGKSTEITDGKLSGDEISFLLINEGRNGNANTNKYSGKVAIDSIVGKIESDRNGQSRIRKWTATRQAAK
jgi:hypothetical protein